MAGTSSDKRSGLQLWSEFSKYAGIGLNIALLGLVASGLEPGQLKYVVNGVAGLLALVGVAIVYLRSRRGKLAAPFRYFFNELPASVGQSRDYRKPYVLTAICDDTVCTEAQELKEKSKELGLTYREFIYTEGSEFWKEELQKRLSETDGICGFWTEKIAINGDLYAVEVENWAIANADKAIILVKRTKENPRTNFEWVETTNNVIPEVLLRGTERARAWRDQASAICVLLWLFVTGMTAFLASTVFLWQRTQAAERREDVQNVAFQSYTKTLRSSYRSQSSKPLGTAAEPMTAAIAKQILDAAASTAMDDLAMTIPKATHMVSFWRSTPNNLKQVGWSPIPGNGWQAYNLVPAKPSIVACAFASGNFVSWRKASKTQFGLPWASHDTIQMWGSDGSIKGALPLQGTPSPEACSFDGDIPSLLDGRTGLLCFAEKVDQESRARNAVCLDTTATDPNFLSEPWVRKRLRLSLPIMESIPDSLLLP